MSNEFARGAKVAVPCSVSQGAFLDEYLITIDTAEGRISGFIDVREVASNEAGSTHVYGVVRGMEDDRLDVFLPGSYFTTNGLAHFSRKMLDTPL